jgi:hypothetical protein
LKNPTACNYSLLIQQYKSVLLDDINFRLINSLLKIAVSAWATLSEQMNLATPRELRREEDAAGSASS